MKTFAVSGRSLNRDMFYECEAIAESESQARVQFRDAVVMQVRAQYGVAPIGVGFLADTRTITVTEIDAGNDYGADFERDES